MPGCVDAYGYLVPDGYGKEARGVDLEVREGSRYSAGDAVLSTLNLLLKVHVRIVRGLSSKVHFKIGLERGLGRRRLGYLKPNRDHGKLRSTYDLNHVQVPIRITGVKRLHRGSNQELARTRVAEAFAFRRMGGTVDFVHGV